MRATMERYQALMACTTPPLEASQRESQHEESPWGIYGEHLMNVDAEGNETPSQTQRAFRVPPRAGWGPPQPDPTPPGHTPKSPEYWRMPQKTQQTGRAAAIGIKLPAYT
jgi:hypothetical protein